MTKLERYEATIAINDMIRLMKSRDCEPEEIMSALGVSRTRVYKVKVGRT